MKKYRLSYDRHLITSSKYDDGFDYKGEHIMGLSIYFEISVFEGDKEVFFTSQDGEEPEERFDFDANDSPIIFHSYLSDAFDFYVDPSEKLGYRMELSNVAKDSKYDFKIKPDDACKWVDSFGNPVIITPEEFVDILTNNIAIFDISSNQPAQCCSYSLNEYEGT